MINWKIYVVVNDSVKMSKGKIAAQVGHGIQYVTEHMVANEPDRWQAYKCGEHPKIVVRASEAQMLELIAKYKNQCKVVIDVGRTQLPPNTMTAVAFYPMIDPDEVLPELTKLSLL